MFARRSRRLYPAREAVVDGELRLTYEQFFERCDRWSSALVALGSDKATGLLHFTQHPRNAQSFYAVPQLGAVCVPLNYRLTADDFCYLINHSGARVVCVHSDYLNAVESIRSELTNVSAFVALDSVRSGWLSYESLLREASVEFAQPPIAETDLLSINYTSGTTSRPKGVMITHRNAYINVVGTLLHHPMTAADRYLWTLPMFHANGWTFVWIVTAVGGTHVCLPRVEPTTVFELVNRIRDYVVCGADGADRYCQCA